MSAARPTVPETFRKIVGFLEKERVPFVLIGGLAAGVQGEPRSTRDVDLMVTLASSDVPKLAAAAQASGFDIDPELAETQWLASGFVRLWLGPAGDRVAADLMACNSEYLRQVAWRAQQTRILGLRVPIATPEDIVLLKLASWRERDIPDVRAVLIRHGDRIDTDYLREWANWFARRDPHFREMPRRLEALLSGEPLPPASPGQE